MHFNAEGDPAAKMNWEVRFHIATAQQERSLTMDALFEVPDLVHFAKEAQAHPSQSGYHVKAAGLTAEGDMVAGANQENSLSDAFAHGETSVVSQIRTRYGNVGIKAIAFYNNTTTDPGELVISPCGACRDVLHQNAGPEMIVAGGNEEVITIARLGDFLKSEFAPVHHSQLSREGVQESVEAIDRSIDTYLPEDRRDDVYGVALVTENGDICRGSLYTNSGYDAVPPGLAAVQTWYNTVGDIDNRFGDFAKIVIARYGQLPDVLYRDRQALLEIDEAVRPYHDRQSPLPVELLAIDPQTRKGTRRVIEAAKTDTLEWLPHPFSAGSFGMDHVIQRQFGKLSVSSFFRGKRGAWA